jgi:hypothetical protein
MLNTRSSLELVTGSAWGRGPTFAVGERNQARRRNRTNSSDQTVITLHLIFAPERSIR